MLTKLEGIQESTIKIIKGARQILAGAASGVALFTPGLNLTFCIHLCINDSQGRKL